MTETSAQAQGLLVLCKLVVLFLCLWCSGPFRSNLAIIPRTVLPSFYRRILEPHSKQCLIAQAYFREEPNLSHAELTAADLQEKVSFSW